MAANYELHYVEYDSIVTTKGSGNDFILFSESNVSSSELVKNKINAKLYNKE